MKTQPNECYSDTAIARELGIPFNDIYEAERNGYLRTVSANESPALAAEGAVLGRDLQAWIGAGMPISNERHAETPKLIVDVQAATVNNKAAEQPPRKGYTMSIISEFDKQVLATMRTYGIDRMKAIIRVARQNPELHAAYVEMTDAQYKAAQGRK